MRSPFYQALTTPDEHATPPLLDAIEIARSPHEGPLATFNGTFTEPLQDKIDYIFIGQPAGERVEEPMGKIEVLRHAILADNQGARYPSDHLPVLVELVVKR